MSYSVFSADQAAFTTRHEDWGSLTWLAGHGVGNAQGLTLGRVVIRKGCSNPRHAHDNCEEALYLLAGELEHTLGEETVILKPGDTLLVAAGLMHNARSIGDVDADMIVAYSEGRRDFRLESQD